MYFGRTFPLTLKEKEVGGAASIEILVVLIYTLDFGLQSHRVYRTSDAAKYCDVSWATFVSWTTCRLNRFPCPNRIHQTQLRTFAERNSEWPERKSWGAPTKTLPFVCQGMLSIVFPLPLFCYLCRRIYAWWAKIEQRKQTSQTRKPSDMPCGSWI